MFKCNYYNCGSNRVEMLTRHGFNSTFKHHLFLPARAQGKVYLINDDSPGEHIKMQNLVLLASKKQALHTKACCHLFVCFKFH